uniref:Uncharacterized protein n=1 Tax=Sinocyclocheilus rhinocerous TaxID=307959 RepID=A0A673KGE1_9TELE
TAILYFYSQTTFVVDEITTVIKVVRIYYMTSLCRYERMSSMVPVMFPQIHSLLFVHQVTCIILQKNGAGLHTASSCFWDNSTDGKTLEDWVISVFGLAI